MTDWREGFRQSVLARDDCHLCGGSDAGVARGPISRCRQRGLALRFVYHHPLCLAFGVPLSVPAFSSRHRHPGTFLRLPTGPGSRSLIRTASGLISHIRSYIRFVEYQRVESQALTTSNQASVSISEPISISISVSVSQPK